MERVKNEVRKRTTQLFKKNLNDRNFMQTINTRVIPVAGYILNVCHLGTGQLDCLDKIVKEELRNTQGHGMQARNEQLYTNRKDRGRELRRFKDVYNETKRRVASYLATTENGWLGNSVIKRMEKGANFFDERSRCNTK